MHSDPIADLLTRIRNGLMAGGKYVRAPHSKIKEEIVKILVAEGFVKSYTVDKETKFPELVIEMKYDSRRKPIIHSIKRISKPGLRVYNKSKAILPIRGGLATRIVTTSQGLMTDREARKKRVGGEVLCEIW